MVFLEFRCRDLSEERESEELLKWMESGIGGLCYV